MASRQAQKQGIEMFCSFTGASKTVAKQFLKACDWSVEAAANAYFENPRRFAGQSSSSKQKGASQERILELYRELEDPNEKVIEVNGIIQLCQRLEVEPTDPVMLVLASECNCQTNCVFTKQEFVSGMEIIGCSNLDDLRAKLPELRQQLDDPAGFKQVYDFAYGYSCTPGQKTLEMETALALWQLLFTGRYHDLSAWFKFIQDTDQKAVSKDTWVLFLDFWRETNGDYSQHDATAAWPAMIDEFVEWIEEQ
eukprot:TRINITY_DN4515_c0_g1_i2.p1 TRINITY_DN4515_c0_g1~~TRINITY_DN4515_c0_g1_i2.p1  ORF type:complete len:252 (+),score=71.21 TRINITY_DN4515_c0_g1_i2:169-924(+)